MEFETVIGIEVHAQLLTRSKIFCSSSADQGDGPNTRTDPYTLGLPGALPALNRSALRMGIQTALALGCRINRTPAFARKHYFYPDLPKGFQISQHSSPLAWEGSLQVLSGSRDEQGNIARRRSRTFRIERLQLEEDAAKSLHRSRDGTLIDLNRAGAPLIEIVFGPDLRSPQEAVDCFAELRRLLTYLEVCDGNLERGSLRCDANISLRRAGDRELGARVELKNLNSFKSLRDSLEFEVARQTLRLQRGGEVERETRLWDARTSSTVALRRKEEASDYRYLPEPDLPPIRLDPQWLEQLASALPELPQPRRRRFQREYGLSLEEAERMTASRGQADYFERVVAQGVDAALTFKWLTGEMARALKSDGRSIESCPIAPEHLAALIDLASRGEVSGTTAKEVFDKMYRSGRGPDDFVVGTELGRIADPKELSRIAEQAIAEFPAEAEAYRRGKLALKAFFVGQIMRRTKGRADPRTANRVMEEMLESHP